jgi:hypothetical protein
VDELERQRELEKPVECHSAGDSLSFLDYAGYSVVRQNVVEPFRGNA